MLSVIFRPFGISAGSHLAAPQARPRMEAGQNMNEIWDPSPVGLMCQVINLAVVIVP